MSEKIVRRGIVSAVYPERHTARVTFPDEDDLVSAELPILTTFAFINKFFHVPDVGEHVYVLYEQNDSGEGDGVILGSIFSDQDPPNAASQDKIRMDFGDGSFFEFDRSRGDFDIKCTGNLNINCTGNVTVNGKNIYLN